MSLTTDQLAALSAHLSTRYAFTVVDPTDAPLSLVLAVLREVTPLAPVIGAVLSAVDDAMARTSVTVPTPFGTYVVLSEAARATVVDHAATLGHEATHAYQIATVGGGQSMVDYLLSAELRATREAHACAVGAWVRYLLTGSLPSPAEAVASLSSPLYLLLDAHRRLAEGIALSGVETIRAGLCPPYSVAAEVLGWLREHAPDAIVPEEHRARATAVPQ